MYMEHDKEVLDDIFARADELNDDPLHGMLVALKLFAEMLGNLPGTHPGCLVSSFVYQDQLMSREVRELTVTGVQGWQKIFRDRFHAIAERYPPKLAVDIDDLADMANTLVDGGIILSKLLRDKDALPKQVMLYREFVRAVFLGV